MLCKIFGACCYGADTVTVTVEVDVAPGLAYIVVGLPDSAVRESQHRIMSSLHHFGYRMPGKRVVVNLAPADLKKGGTGFDLPIAVGILIASGQIDVALDMSRFLIMGELALDGTLRRFNGSLAIAADAAKYGFECCIFPSQCRNECSWVRGVKVYCVDSLDQVIELLSGKVDASHFMVNGDAYKQGFSECGELFGRYREKLRGMLVLQKGGGGGNPGSFFKNDLAFIRGQERAKLALEICAAGRHNLLLSGSPGCGKSMMAAALPTIMPPLTYEQSVEAGRIYSIYGKEEYSQDSFTMPPFRAPHHSITNQALVGGGSDGRLPGEISLATQGVLFLDEILEFKRDTLELLRQPLEERRINISRVHGKFSYPADFILVAAANPCPCGYLYEKSDRCRCSSSAISKYRSRLSGPFLDRMDICLRVPALDNGNLLSDCATGESSASVALRVLRAVEIQWKRFGSCGGVMNSTMGSGELRRYCSLGADAKRLMQVVSEKNGLSARGYTRCLKVARTIADLNGREGISLEDISMALQFRFPEQNSLL